jgi:hypothetical protein
MFENYKLHKNDHLRHKKLRYDEKGLHMAE